MKALQSITRREFLRGSALAAAAGVLAACAPAPTPAPTPEPAGEAAPTEVIEQVEPTAAPAEPTAAPQSYKVNWMGPFVPAYRMEYLTNVLIPSYKEVAPNVEIVAEQATSWPDTEEKLMVRYAAGGGPDLVQTYFAPLDFASRGMFAALNPFLEADDRVKGEHFFVSLMKGAQYDGKTYGLPHNAITQIFFYNKQHFAAAGLAEPPKTLVELAEFAQKLTAVKSDANIDYAMQIQLNDADTFAAYLYANGGRFVDDECQRLFYDDTMLETLKYIVDLIKAGHAAPFGSAADVPNGKAAMRYSVPILVGNTKTQFPDVYENLGAALVPAGPGGNTSYSWAHYEHIMSNSKVKEAAWDFLAWMLSDEKTDVEFHDQQNFVPTQPRTYANKLFAEHWAWSVFAKQLAQCKSAPTCIKWRAAYTEVMTPELEAAWTLQKTPEEVIATMNQKLPGILGIS